jgi:hypothetical protein
VGERGPGACEPRDHPAAGGQVEMPRMETLLSVHHPVFPPVRGLRREFLSWYSVVRSHGSGDGAETQSRHKG